jgi:hypothetical protein
MASSPTVMAPPVPLQSPESTPVDLCHPMPDLQSLQGAYVGNIERLEEHAERMSEPGSDLGEEIRKLHEEQKLSDSRRSSLLSGPPAEEALRPFSTRSRGCSTSSYTNSIVDVNGAARWGGYSPNAYITSPAGSLRSGSGSQSLPALQRQRSSSKASRLGQIVQSEEEEEEEKDIQGAMPPIPDQSQPPTERKVSSFTREYDQIAEDIHNELRNSVAFAEHYDAQQPLPFDDQTYAELPDRPATAASTDTAHKLGTLWHDFDGVHCPDTVPEEGPVDSYGSGSRQSSATMKSALNLPPQGAPPPSDDMVFYPAPVPKMLNLPKRLSQLPAANVQARRRTQLLESMQAENGKSAPWLSEAEGGTSNSNRNSVPLSSDPSGQSPKAKRKSRMSLANLPPQLRASAYFDQAAPTQEYDVKGESAEDTLNNILEASAHAPVTAFTDHPFAGHVGDEVYGRERKAHKRNKSQANELEKMDNRKSRSSLNLLDTRRNSSGDPLNKLKKRNSSADLNMLTVRATESRMSLGQELDNQDADATRHSLGDDDTPRRQSITGEHHENVEEEEGEEEPEGEQYFGAPTTLLAELQMRKQQQKTRNLTAATAFPNGMHATLLELDAVAEIEKKKRRGQKVNLAWEAQQHTADDDDSDDDVPLGVLFPGRDGLINKRAGAAQSKSDWERPLGLMAQRDLEDNEPLSKRRSRLQGNRATSDFSALKRQTQLMGSQSQLHLAVPASTTPQPESEEDEGETLAQRIRRLKDRQALDDAIGADVRKSTVSGDFAAELNSQFGMPTEEEKPKPTASPANGDGEEETLGQRRARLQAEALARGDANPLGNRPPLRNSMSMADLLGANPINPSNSARKVSDEQLLSALPKDSLLRKNAEKQERKRISRMDMNNRMSSYDHFNQPLLGGNVGKMTDDQPIAAKIQAYKDKLSGVSTPMAATPSTMFGNQMVLGMTPSNSAMNLPGQRESYYPQAGMPMMGMNNMGMAAPSGYGSMMAPQMMNPQLMSMNMNMMGTPIAGMQGMAYPLVGGMSNMGARSGMGSVAGMRQSSMMNLPGSMQMGGMGGVMMMEPPMDPRQRSAIDQWRQGVGP